jgi:flagellar hook assembly protein FlgD
MQNTLSRNSISQNLNSGILIDSGANQNLAPPVISSASSTQVTGTAAPGSTIEIFTDSGNQGMSYQGETNSDDQGNFNWTGNIEGELTNVTATATDAQGNTSGFSSPALMTGIEEDEETMLPETFSLSQNFPNPFNPQTTIHFTIPVSERVLTPVKLNVYNLQGELIRVLIDEDRAPGNHQVHWDGLDESGHRTASGIYIYKLQAGDFKATRKMAYMK